MMSHEVPMRIKGCLQRRKLFFFMCECVRWQIKKAWLFSRETGGKFRALRFWSRVCDRGDLRWSWGRSLGSLSRASPTSSVTELEAHSTASSGLAERMLLASS